MTARAKSSRAAVACRLLLAWIMDPRLFALAAVFFVGCQRLPPAQKGGTASTTLRGMQMPAIAPETTATLAQPENPAAESSQTVERTETRQEAAPLPSVKTTVTEHPGGVRVTVTEQFLSPVVLTHTVAEKTATTIGPSWQDKTREIVAKMAGTAGTRAAGVGLILFALACFHPAVRKVVGAGKTIPALAAVAGFGLVFGGQLIAGHEPLAMLIIAAGLLVAFLVVRLSHKEGIADALSR